jgi:hypothetical protein
VAATLSSVVWLIGLVVVVAIVIAAARVALARRRRSAMPATSTGAARADQVDEPMTGLESALALVTDRHGRPIRERIDAESQHVDDLRVPDDTGPLLRRALDHVEQPGATRDQAANTAPGTATADGA